MAKHLSNYEDALRQLTAPARNRYFYGKLLDAHHFEMEQKYVNRKRWLLNRLALGAGVVCGLSVEPKDGSQVQITPGVAVDRLGREIVVPPPPRTINPRQVTDECGRVVGEVEGKGVVSICLAYHECEAEPVPVLVGDCDTKQTCAPSTIRERYMLLVRERKGEAETIEPACELPGLFTPPEGEEGVPNIHPRLVERTSQTCPEVDGNACIELAQINLPEAGQRITAEMIDMNVRPVVHNNKALFGLILCLAERVAECCRVRILRKVSGDAQRGEPKAVLDQPLIVAVVNGYGRPVVDEEVTFQVQGGDGLVGDGIKPDKTYTVKTGRGGRAQARWWLGPEPGLNVVEAIIASGSRVVFHAHAEVSPRILHKVSGDAQRGEPKAALDQPLIVAVVDGYGKPVVGEEVTFQVQGGDGLVGDGIKPIELPDLKPDELPDLKPDELPVVKPDEPSVVKPDKPSVVKPGKTYTVKTGKDGRARARWWLGPEAGLNVVEAIISSGSRVVFHALAEIGGPILRYVSGNDQQAAPEAILDQPLEVKVLEGGNPVAGETVTFRVLEGDGDVGDGSTFAEKYPLSSDASGMAHAWWRLGPAPGPNALEATIPSGSRVIFKAVAIGDRVLLYVSGNDQQGSPEAILAQPLAVKVLDGAENPVAGETVTFRILEGDGGVGDGSTFAEKYPLSSDANGMAHAWWRLGPAPGSNALEATIPSGSRVIFKAVAEETVPLPVIEAIWPPNSTPLSESENETLYIWFKEWVSGPRLEITFYREMDMSRLKKLEPWLRLWQIRRPVLPPGQDKIQVRRIELFYEGPTDTPVLGTPGFTAIYTLEAESVEELMGARYLVQIRATDENIVDTSTPPLLLDADFTGTGLSPEQLDRIWEVQEVEMPEMVWNAFVNTGAQLPSGNGISGGLFHSWFEVAPE